MTEQFTEYSSVIGRITSLERLAVRDTVEANFFWGDGVLAQFLAFTYFTDACWRTQGTFIDAVFSMDDKSVLAAQIQ